MYSTCSWDAVDEDLAITPEDIRYLIKTLAGDLQKRESEIDGTLPIDSPMPVYSSVAAAAEELGSDERTLRSVPALNAFIREIDEPLPDGLVRVLAGLDAEVHALDDIIDTRKPSQREKMVYATNVVFSKLFMLEHLPTQHHGALVELKYQYLTELAQTPAVERQMLEQMARAKTRQQRLDAATTSYEYDARVITAFAEIPALVCGLGENETRRLVSDVRSCHARQLIFEELRQVRRDLEQGDRNPVLHILRESSDSAAVAEFVRDLTDQFQYSTEGRATYGDVLGSLERQPADLEAAATEAMAELDRWKRSQR